MFTQDPTGGKLESRDEVQGRTLDTTVANILLGEQYSAPMGEGGGRVGVWSVE